MRKLMYALLIGVFALSFTGTALASDWDVAGKILTGVEGLRIITGGRVDPVGAMIQVVQGPRQGPQERYRPVYEKPAKRVWVPEYVWKREYIPQHEEYSERYGKVIVEGHYIQYRVECGGHWEEHYDGHRR